MTLASIYGVFLVNQIDIKKKYTSGTPGKVLDAEYIYYDTAPDYAKKLAIVCSGYEKCMPDYEINRGNYPYYFIKYTIKGHGGSEVTTMVDSRVKRRFWDDKTVFNMRKKGIKNTYDAGVMFG